MTDKQPQGQGHREKSGSVQRTQLGACAVLSVQPSQHQDVLMGLEGLSRGDN